MKLKYYSGAQVMSILEKLPSKEYLEMLNAFAKEPSADVVEVVRCKDCKHSEYWYKDKRRCFLWHEAGIDVFEGGFCSYGERREE